MALNTGLGNGKNGEKADRHTVYTKIHERSPVGPLQLKPSYEYSNC